MESEENIVPVIIRASGTINKGLDQYLQLLPGHPIGHRTVEDHTNEPFTHHS